ncbi:hypothetical protein GA0115255_123353, partial [Streptomyces sp. Ncost-T6T-2b]
MCDLGAIDVGQQQRHPVTPGVRGQNPLVV